MPSVRSLQKRAVKRQTKYLTGSQSLYGGTVTVKHPGSRRDKKKYNALERRATRKARRVSHRTGKARLGTMPTYY